MLSHVAYCIAFLYNNKKNMLHIALHFFTKKFGVHFHTIISLSFLVELCALSVEDFMMILIWNPIRLILVVGNRYDFNRYWR